jgi:hypothetical protein
MFCSSLGYSLQVYFCATAMAEVYCVNNSEKGGPVSQIDKITYQFSKYKDNVFIDNLTGDYFSYNHELQKWMP